jgi:hypothetical protein
VDDQRNRHGVWPLKTRSRCRPGCITSLPVSRDSRVKMGESHKLLLLLPTNNDDSSGVLRCQLRCKSIIDHHQHALNDMSRRCRYGLCNSLGAHGHRPPDRLPSACGCQNCIRTLLAWHMTSLPVVVGRFPEACTMKSQGMFIAVTFEVSSQAVEGFSHEVVYSVPGRRARGVQAGSIW